MSTDQPDFGGDGHVPVLLKHPAVVGEQLLEAEPHGEDESQPQQGAEHHCSQHHLTLTAQRLAAGGREGRDKSQTGSTELSRLLRHTLKETQLLLVSTVCVYMRCVCVCVYEVCVCTWQAGAPVSWR